MSDENLAALVDGSANAEQLATWKADLASPDSSTLRTDKKQAGPVEPVQAVMASADVANDDEFPDAAGSLRHTVIASLAKAGPSPEVAMDLAGHTDVTHMRHLRRATMGWKDR